MLFEKSVMEIFVKIKVGNTETDPKSVNSGLRQFEKTEDTIIYHTITPYNNVWSRNIAIKKNGGKKLIFSEK